MEVEGSAGGPYTVLFDNADAGLSEPSIEGSGLGLTPPGSVSVSSTQDGGVAYDTHYHFEYVSQKQYEAEKGFVKAASTPEVDSAAATKRSS